MTHLFAFIPAKGCPARSLGQLGTAILARFKEVQPRLTRENPWVHLTLAPRLREENVPWAEDPATGTWLTWTGVWVYRDGAIPALDGDALLQRYLEIGARKLAEELQGQFAIMIGDGQSEEILIITDRCGNLHLFAAVLADGTAISSSSAVLSALQRGNGRAHDQFDPIGLHEFIATGVVYDNRTIWANVKKIGAGLLYRITPNGIRQERYWHFSDISPETHSLDEAVELTFHGISSSAREIAKAFPKIVSDLTGGYDSRALLCGLLDTGAHFETTVSGPPMSPDVVVSTQIANAFSITHTHHDSQVQFEACELIRALNLTDGEYDIFDYARIAAIHTRLSQNYQISLNGSFGELARGYWWELIWPKTTARIPLSGELVSRKRFAATPYTREVFSSSCRLDLRECLADVLDRTVREVNHFPRSSQMDAMYYYQRMAHWQGRIVSSTNQIWPCLSPFSFPQVLVPILETKADARIRSRLVRTLFERHQPKLARMPLEHGYPPRPFTLFNSWQFLPLLNHYAHLVEAKLASRLASKLPRTKPATGHPAPSLEESYPSVFHEQGLAVKNDRLMLLEGGLFNETVIKRWFSPKTLLNDAESLQWRRLATVEILLRRLKEI